MKRNLRVLGSYLLVSLFVSNTLASEPELSLAAATKIARQQAVKDRLPDTHIVVEGIELPKPKHRVYLARFEPTVSDPTSKEPNRFVGYIIEMDGSMRRTTIVRTTTKAPVKLAPNTGAVSSGSERSFLEKPYRMTLDQPAPAVSPMSAH